MLGPGVLEAAGPAGLELLARKFCDLMNQLVDQLWALLESFLGSCCPGKAGWQAGWLAAGALWLLADWWIDDGRLVDGSFRSSYSNTLEARRVRRIYMYMRR